MLLLLLLMLMLFETQVCFSNPPTVDIVAVLAIIWLLTKTGLQIRRSSVIL